MSPLQEDSCLHYNGYSEATLLEGRFGDGKSACFLVGESGFLLFLVFFKVRFYKPDNVVL